MRLDSHQHFWRYDAAHYPWMTDRMGELRRDRLPAELEPLLGAVGFHGSIVVQARQVPDETEWLLGLAGRHAFMLRPEFRRDISLLGKFGLTYDLLQFPRHLRTAVRLVEELPDQPFVLDHMGKPSIRTGEISPWREDLARLAKSPNVYCKLSGMVTEARWNRWAVEGFRRYLDAVLDAFGADRLMIGSDWPVCLLSGTYESAMRIVTGYVEQFPKAARDGILGGNCARFYGIAGDSGRRKPQR